MGRNNTDKSLQQTKQPLAQRVKKEVQRSWPMYVMLLPAIILALIFCYAPMGGLVMAFQNYKPWLGITGSEFVGLDNFKQIFEFKESYQAIINTFIIAVSKMVLGLIFPIIVALLLNEVHCKKYKSVAQTLSYLPHFVSMVVTAGIIKEFCMSDGLLNDIIVLFGGSRSALLQRPELYRTIYIVSDIWQEIGWGSIIYLAALAGIDQQLYEAAEIDGAGKWQQTLNVTIPGITPTIITMFILRVGNLMSMGYEKTILLYSSATYETADIISSYIYRVGLQEQSWSYSTAIGLFNSVINCILLVVTNKISKRVAATSLW